MSFHTKTLVDGHRMFRCIQGIFCSIFFIFQNTFKMYFHNRCICSYEPKHHIPTIATSLESFMIKRTKKERDQEANANSGRNLPKRDS
jgi:hypothetical protein